jgi:hypothetical protein
MKDLGIAAILTAAATYLLTQTISCARLDACIPWGASPEVVKACVEANR